MTSTTTGIREKPRLLLHACCGPCSTAVVERLAEGYDITLFFYNPNITDTEEYKRRIAGEIQYLRCYNRTVGPEKEVHFREGRYDPETFRAAVRGLEAEPEGGERCSVCYRLRLEETARAAGEGGFDAFTTTLSVSPHKSHGRIRAIGQEAGEASGVRFLEDDFKKKAGYQRSIALSKEMELYRQTYCGCEFSK